MDPREEVEPCSRPDEARAPALDHCFFPAQCATGDQSIVEVSTRGPWWGDRPVAERYEDKNVLGHLWMELRQQLRDGDPRARSGAWLGRIRVGRLAGAADGAGAVPQTA